MIGVFKPSIPATAVAPPRKIQWSQQKSTNCSTSSLGRPWSEMGLQPPSRSQASTFGRASSTSQLKKGLGKLPPLPKQPITFENLYVIAKKRASVQMMESRKAAVLIKSSTSPASSRIHQPRSLSAFALDTQEQPDPEEQAWASDILASVPLEDPEVDVAPGRRAPSKESDAFRLASKQGSGSKQRPSGANERRVSASAVMASQIANPSENQSDDAPGRRATRETAAESASVYIQALRVLMDSDVDWGKDNSVAQAVAAASQSGGISQRVQFNVQGFTDEEVKRMRVAFGKFKAREGQEIHKDDLHQALTFLGYMKVTDEICQELADQITTYSLLDWEEYNDFMEKFREYERDEFFAEFTEMDVDRSGQLSMKELKVLISGLGVTPFRETLSEAMAVVDFDGSGLLDFDEFVHLMAVYRVSEGFTRDEICRLKVLFDRVAVRVPGGPREVKADRLGDAMTHMFGPQAAGLAQKLARRFDPSADKLRGMGSSRAEDDYASLEPGLPFPEFLLWCRRLREAEIEEYRMHFEAADIDASGRIGPEEMRQVITNVGYMPLRTIVNEVLDKVDVDGDRQLDFDEFVNLMAVFRKTDGFCAAEVIELGNIFDDFKQDDDNVDCLELMDMLRSMGYVTNLDAVRQFIKLVDIDNTNSLDLPEFIRLMRMHREVELNQALKVFNQGKQESNGLLKAKNVARTLNKIEYLPTEEMLVMAMQQLIDKEENEFDDKEEKPPPAELDFDQLVQVIDFCRRQLSEMRRKMAGYSDEEVNKYSVAFKIYDEDDSGDIEKHELTNLLNDLGIPMRSKAEQNDMLEKLDVARAKAKAAGVEEELLGEMGDPSVTFSVLLFLVRILHTAADQAEVDRDRKITEHTNFSPKEAQDFREIFVFWCNKAAALNAGQEAPSSPGGASKTTIGGKDAPEEQARNLFLSADGCRRCVRSLGLQMTPQDKKDLEEKLDMGPTSAEAPGKYGFFEFLLFMRWVLDNNFGHINETCALVAANASPVDASKFASNS